MSRVIFLRAVLIAMCGDRRGSFSEVGRRSREVRLASVSGHPELDHARAHPCGLGNVLRANQATEPKKARMASVMSTRGSRCPDMVPACPRKSQAAAPAI